MGEGICVENREVRIQSTFFKTGGVVLVEGDKVPFYIYNPIPSQNHIAILVYGGSPGFNRDHLWLMAEELAHSGIFVATFDFRGNTPATKNRFYETGLSSRLTDTKRIIETIRKDVFFSECKITLIGISMGGYVAVKLLNDFDISNLILIAPAAYTPLASRYPFGLGFSQVIRHEKSWESSDTFSIIASFKGPLMILQYEKDKIVPPQIPQKYFYSASSTNDKHLIVLGNHEHNAFVSKNSKKQEELLAVILPWLKTRI